ncbi:winged helix DNA-binding domain-containing protein [Pseudonocardia acaciae]|uniref:winged helix DNA-binding domain-containing protein n=1 Tax=Pseudonocardia acaciae TaxID=551276 RepID=UPI00048B3C91|nr:winged helix DNA-binding domain-containing protein [Pseudonocardia acaciae]
MTRDVLGVRALNRALLARQLLLERVRRPVLDVLTHLVGLQAQAPDAPYYGLWSRIDGFAPDRLAGLLTDRSAVRATMMRGTLHAVTAEDCLAFRMLAQPTLEREVRTNTDFDGHLVDGMAVADVLAAGADLLAEKPRTVGELRTEFAARWPDRDPKALSIAARALVPLVQVPPRGIWGVGGLPRLAPVASWLGRPVRADPDPGELVLRYLAAFGPATVPDIATWSGLTGVREVVAGLRERLWVARDERGRELFDLPDAPRPDPGTPAPVRLVAPFDNVVLAHADRSRIVPERHRHELASKNGIVPGTVLVGGFVAGVWDMTRRRGEAPRVGLRLFEPLDDRAAERQLRDETDRLAAFAGASEGATATTR